MIVIDPQITVISQQIETAENIFVIDPQITVISQQIETAKNIFVIDSRVGPKGEPGEQGIPGEIIYENAPSFLYAEGIASQIIQGHRVVVETSAGQFRKASNTQPADAFSVVGLSLTSSLTGGLVQVASNGIIGDSSFSAFTPGAQLYLGVDGMLTQTVPEAPAVFRLPLGYVLQLNRVQFSIGSPIFLG